MMDRKSDKILSTTSSSCPSSGPRAGLVFRFSIHHIENWKTVKSTFSQFHFLVTISLAFHLVITILFPYYLLVTISLGRRASYTITDVSLNDNQLVMTNFDKFCHIHQL